MPPKIICVVPTVRTEALIIFKDKWRALFDKHDVTLIVVKDGESQRIAHNYLDEYHPHDVHEIRQHKHLFCRFTDACRNLGFVVAAKLKPDYILTLDDDVYPVTSFPMGQDYDPIQAHIDVLNKRVPISWINTAMNTDFMRGFPYAEHIREEAPVMLSHGVWYGVPDYDGETQKRLMDKHGNIPHTLKFYNGPIPRKTHFPLCGMNVMVKLEALPYLYYAPMGPDTGFPELQRFADIYMGIELKTSFDMKKWAVWSGNSIIYHSRMSDAEKNIQQEKLGRGLLEEMFQKGEFNINAIGKRFSDTYLKYFSMYLNMRLDYEKLIRDIIK